MNAEYVLETYVSEVNLTGFWSLSKGAGAGYLASGTSYALWFHVGAIHQVIKEKFPEIFEDEPPEDRASTKFDD